MLYLNEACELNQLSKYNLRDVKILKHSRIEHTVKVKYDVGFIFLFFFTSHFYYIQTLHISIFSKENNAQL